MDLSNIISHIETECASINQVIHAEGITRQTIDTSLIVYDLLKGTVSNRAYPLKMPDEPTLPSVVYQLVSSNKIGIDQVDILQTDLFIVYFHVKNYDDLIALRGTIRTAFLGYSPTDEAGVIEITDEALDYMPDQQAYRCAMEVTVTGIIGVDQSSPAVFVYESSSSAYPANEFQIIQNVLYDISFLIVCKQTNLEATKNCLKTNLLGYQETEYYNPTEYIGGERLDCTGDIVVWRESYQTSVHQRET